MKPYLDYPQLTNQNSGLGMRLNISRSEEDVFYIFFIDN